MEHLFEGKVALAEITIPVLAVRPGGLYFFRVISGVFIYFLGGRNQNSLSGSLPVLLENAFYYVQLKFRKA